MRRREEAYPSVRLAYKKGGGKDGGGREESREYIPLLIDPSYRSCN